MTCTWRDRFQPIIAEVLREHAGEPLPVIRASLRKAFPAGPRQHWPYKVWLDECRIQLGRKKRPNRLKKPPAARRL